MFIRSTAAGERLGGLAPATRAAAGALAAAFDVVVIETVGVGQSETEVADVADTVAVVVQPGSGDVLQFLKSGIMEIPDVLVVTKADLGRGRRRGRSRTSTPLCARWARRPPWWPSPRSPPGTGIEALIDALDAAPRRPRSARPAVAQPPDAHALADFVAEHGERGLRALGGRRAAERWLADQPPGPTWPASSEPSRSTRE